MLIISSCKRNYSFPHLIGYLRCIIDQQVVSELDDYLINQFVLVINFNMVFMNLYYDMLFIQFSMI